MASFKDKVMIANLVTYETLALFLIFSLGISTVPGIFILLLVFPVFFGIDWLYRRRRPELRKS